MFDILTVVILIALTAVALTTFPAEGRSELGRFLPSRDPDATPCPSCHALTYERERRCATCGR